MKLIKTILIFLIAGQVSGTAQISDFLIYKGDTLSIYSKPLESYFEKKGTRTIGGQKMEGNCTALWRGYVATWEIEDDCLFLINLKTDYCGFNITEIDISKEFGSKKIFANWVSFEIINPHGKRIKYIYQAYESVYEYEKGFVFKDGILQRINNYDNSKSRQSKFRETPDSLFSFLDRNINWELIDKANLGEKTRVIASFKADQNGRPIDIEVVRGINTQIDNEAKRVISQIPEWDVYFKKGKVIETLWTLPIFFEKDFYKKKLKKQTE